MKKTVTEREKMNIEKNVILVFIALLKCLFVIIYIEIKRNRMYFFTIRAKKKRYLKLRLTCKVLLTMTADHNILHGNRSTCSLNEIKPNAEPVEYEINVL